MEDGEVDFPAFPYKPYTIQVDFMKFLYQSLERGGISMLESPTGTGKTLSVICSALQWLVDKKKKGIVLGNGEEKVNGDDKDDDDPDWIRNFVPNKVHGVSERKPVMSKKIMGSFSEDKMERGGKEVRRMEETNGFDDEDVSEFLLEDYDSGEDNSGKSKRTHVGGDDSSSGEEEEDDETELKVYFCSRTHSQLSQFMKELKKTTFARELKIVCLGSRKNFCINEGVLKLRSLARINERCLELQKQKKPAASKQKQNSVLFDQNAHADFQKLVAGKQKKCNKGSCGCPMLRRQKVNEFRDEVSRQQAPDIEDLVNIGRILGSCPYYGSRKMIPTADLVVLPYQSLLSKSSRESLGLKLKGSVVIIDEAHNLSDALISMHNAKVTLPQLKKLQSCLESYYLRFCDLLGPTNRRYIQILKILVGAFIQILCDDTKVMYTCSMCDAGRTTSASVSTMTINEFLFSLNIDNINLFKVLQHMKETNIIYKITGYGDKVAASQEVETLGDDREDSEEESTITGFRAFSSILSSLVNNDSAGKIFIAKPQGAVAEGYIKYVMLTGEKIFSEISNEAHSIVLIGGTLKPIEETRERLFPSLQLAQLPFFSCGHIIPSENILPLAVKHGPSGKSLDFSYKMRSSPAMIEELGRLLCNLVSVVPEGVVVFFSSFDYENQVYSSWKSSGILSRIMKKKHIFREPRRNTDIEAFLKEYKNKIDSSYNAHPGSCTGALLLAVVGGKVSEGINFSDGAGRCIVMVGLPYPSPSDTELMERVKHIEGLEKNVSTKRMDPSACPECKEADRETGFHILRSCKGRGKDYYENICMKAVNQCIGRAIRHVNDYAAILLLDARYTSESIENSFSHPTHKLPQWIKHQLVTKTSNYGEVQKSCTSSSCSTEGRKQQSEEHKAAAHTRRISCISQRLHLKKLSLERSKGSFGTK